MTFERRIGTVSASAVVRRLDALSPLSQDGADAVQRAAQACVRLAQPREDLVSEGDKPGTLRMIVDGWACRYKMLEDGRRQILGFLLPGDTCDYNMFLVPAMDHGVGALTPVVYSDLTQDVFEALTGEHPSVARALICETLSNASMQREWIVNLGQRVPFERLAHLLCEVFVRCQIVGLAEGTSCPFPITQVDLADATGMSAVHVNRTLQDLRGAGLIELERRSLVIRDTSALHSAALFDAGYLHLRHQPDRDLRRSRTGTRSH